MSARCLLGGCCVQYKEVLVVLLNTDSWQTIDPHLPPCPSWAVIELYLQACVPVIRFNVPSINNKINIELLQKKNILKESIIQL